MLLGISTGRTFVGVIFPHPMEWCLVVLMLNSCFVFCPLEKLTFRSVQTPQEFRQSEDAEVVCDVISSPVPAVSWFYKNKEILSEPNSKTNICKHTYMCD